MHIYVASKDDIDRSSHRRCSVNKGGLRNFTKITGKHLCQSHIFNKVAGLSPATLLKKRLWNRCFPVNFVKFLRTPFSQNTSVRLLLHRIQNRNRRKTKTEFSKRVDKNPDLHKPVLNKVMNTHELCVKCNFGAPLICVWHLTIYIELKLFLTVYTNHCCLVSFISVYC